MKRWVFLLVILWAAPTWAQVRDPTTVEFVPSADHNAVYNGAPIVTNYVLYLYYADDLSGWWGRYDLGKPTPDGATGLITLSHPEWFHPQTDETLCLAIVSAVGPNGESFSQSSNLFITSTEPTTAPIAVHDLQLIPKGAE